MIPIHTHLHMGAAWWEMGLSGGQFDILKGQL